MQLENTCLFCTCESSKSRQTRIEQIAHPCYDFPLFFIHFTSYYKNWKINTNNNAGNLFLNRRTCLGYSSPSVYNELLKVYLQNLDSVWSLDSLGGYKHTMWPTGLNSPAKGRSQSSCSNSIRVMNTTRRLIKISKADKLVSLDSVYLWKFPPKKKHSHSVCPKRKFFWINVLN